ncbi:MFS transporter [Glonium stellatum]|uniref:MFS transporter n=1 Tax=Glonium stellatum TaxID=574774 RepID=A0A8E2F1M2_9PEZI|nr:MFS transporter [Glonium stellatum]
MVCLSIGFVGQLAASYPASVIGVTLAQPAFLEYMGLVTLVDGKQQMTKNANSLIGATTGVFQAGAFCGVLAGSWVMDRYGRKAGTVFCATLSIVGGTCLCAAQSIAMFIVFRFFAGAGSMAFVGLIPVYSAELAPPKLRGIFVGMNLIGITFGYALASYMGLAFYFAKATAAQWRAPLGLALIFPVAMLLVLPFVPESPRWLLMVGRADEARKVTMQLHSVRGGGQDDSDGDGTEYARREFCQMQMQTALDQTLNPTWLQMFTRHSYRKRVVATCGFAFLGQSTAILVINNYGPTIYRTLGYGTLDQLILQCGWITVSIPSNIFGACIVDRVGRKPLMLASVSACCTCLIIETALIASFASPIGAIPNQAALRACVAIIYLFQAVYGVGIDGAGVVFYSEVFPTHLRAKGVALAMATISLANLTYLQVTATAFANIGWRFFLVFIAISSVGLVWIYLYIPETKGVPLEEIAALFGDPDEVAIFSENIQLNRETNELVINNNAAHPLADSSTAQHLDTKQSFY